VTTLREKLTTIGANVVCHAKTVTFRMAEVAISREQLATIPDRIGMGIIGRHIMATARSVS
jgi:hypothetical protein